MDNDSQSPRRRGAAAASAASVVVFVALMPTLAGATSNKATLSVHPPSNASVSNGGYEIRSSGYSGQFNRLIMIGDQSKCPRTAKDALKKYGSLLDVHKLTKQHSFDVGEEFLPKKPGKRYACAYLFANRKPGGKQKHKSKPFTVGP